MAAGMILGAYNGMDAIPEHWLSEMTAFRRIENLLEKI
jgi:ADP-ribosylglycohydrolase